MKKITLTLAAFCLMAAAFSVSAFSQGQTIYNSVPTTLPGNTFSVGFEATSTSELGDRVQFSAGSGRSLLTVTQTMSSWACQSGAWFTHDCVTATGATFSHPITLTIYGVGPGNEPGAVIGSLTQTFNIPYRPSADNTNCTGGRWFDGTNCWNGYAFNITFNVNALTVPDTVIYGVAYNTSHYGDSPLGESTPCYGTAAGCGYDSLNVATQTFPTTVGVNPAPNDGYLNSSWNLAYCDEGVVGGTGSFRLDAGCWTGFEPPVRFTAANVPTNANQCKNNGWQTRTRADGSAFRNQGDCIQYVNTGR